MDTNCWFGSADVITDTSPLPTPVGANSSAKQKQRYTDIIAAVLQNINSTF